MGSPSVTGHSNSVPDHKMPAGPIFLRHSPEGTEFPSGLDNNWCQSKAVFNIMLEYMIDFKLLRCRVMQFLLKGWRLKALLWWRISYIREGFGRVLSPLTGIASSPPGRFGRPELRGMDGCGVPSSASDNLSYASERYIDIGVSIK